ncbi:Glyoxalase/bleomycin resistance protein/dioxygenase [Intrasporangium calvum DSM 43043]|uniref:Glyoxalase/bleomycin resistance protein/dioxygenase n=2 Tax=Intrasporangium calvum TaxID=53358 RepID=E6SB07_INTC7|nr:Glyoxalase/bleomycin resistance protein/dioxygenase [Intrasporangium calvum DSM 43043]
MPLGSLSEALSPGAWQGYRRSMITAVHTLIYSDDAPATRAFLRDVLQWRYVSDAVPEGEPEWLIFRTGPSEVGVHPTGGSDPATHTSRHHSISLMCDDLDSTMAELASRGAQFATDPVDARFGRIVFMSVPGADDIMLYQPQHAVAYSLED